MSAMRITIARPIRTAEAKLARPLATFLLAATVFGVLFAGLFPFDFTIPRNVGIVEKIRRDFDRSPEPPLLQDRVVNVIFFVPLGFFLAAVVSSRSRGGLTPEARAARQIPAAFIIGATLSGIVEVGQVFLGFRDPTWSDVFMNTIGSALGAVVYMFVGDAVIRTLAAQLAGLAPFATARALAIIAIAFAALVVLLPLLTRDRGELTNWESAYPLMLGNELTRDRPWRGTVAGLSIASRAIDEAQVARLAAGESPPVVLGDSLIGSYALMGKGPFVDQCDRLPTLEWIGGPSEEQAADAPARVSDNHWLRTSKSVGEATQRIEQTEELTVVVDRCASDDLSLNGPGRIASISSGTSVRNLTIGQEGDHLAVRLRTIATGQAATSPQVEVDDIFTDPSSHQIIVTYKQSVLVIYVDGQPRGRLEITPEAALIWQLYPRDMWRIRIENAGFRSYAVVYRMLAFIPLAALLVAATSLSKLRAPMRWLTIIATIVLVALLLELIIGRLMVSGFQSRNLVISVLIAGLTVLAIKLRRRGTVATLRSR